MRWFILSLGVSLFGNLIWATQTVPIQLQQLILDAESKLAPLEPWQTKIFREEVVPQSQKFVRDFRQSTAGLNVEIDFDAIKNYLRFYAPKHFPLDQAMKGPEILLSLVAESTCTKCIQSAAELKKLMKERVERRGFIPTWIEALSSDQVEKLLSNGNKVAALLVETKKAAGDDEDAAHADEQRFTIRSSLQIRGLGQQKGQLEIFDTGSFEKTAHQLLTDLFAEVGKKLDQNLTQSNSSERNEYLLEVTGIQSFGHYERVKKTIFSLVTLSKNTLLATIEERKISRGRVGFAIVTNQPLAEVKTFFARLAEDLNEPGMSQSGIQWEIH